MSPKQALMSSTVSTPDDPYVVALKADFRNFVYAIWKFLELPSPTALQFDIAQYLQTGPKRRIIMAFRGAGKSWITAAYALWRLYRNPNTKIMVVSAGQERSTGFTTFVLRLIHEMPELAHLKPRPEQRQSVLAFDVNGAKPDQTPSVRSTGIFGQLTGGRADVIIADDVETTRTAGSEVQRLRLQEGVKEFDAVLKPNGEVIYLGTPQIEMSLYFELQNRGYECRVWPARYPNDKQRPAYGDRLAAFCDVPEKGGQSVEPGRFTDADLADREKSYGKSGFALQFMLDPRASDKDRYPLKLSDMIVMDLSDPDKGPVSVAWTEDPMYLWKDIPVVGLGGDRLRRPFRVSEEWADFGGSVMFIDPSGKGKDETAFAIVKHLAGKLYLMDAGGRRGGYDEETLTWLAEKAKAQKVNLILVESNFGQGMFKTIFQPYVTGITIEDVRATGQKEVRIIETLEPILNQHRLIVNAALIRSDFKSTDEYHDMGDRAQVYQLMYQLTRVTRERNCLAHDDRLDAVAGAVRYWTQIMAQDNQEAEAVTKREAMEKLMEDAEAGLVRAISGMKQGIGPGNQGELWVERGAHLR